MSDTTQATPSTEAKTTKSIVPSKYSGRYKNGGDDPLAQFIKGQCVEAGAFVFEKFFQLCLKNGVAQEKVEHYRNQVRALVTGDRALLVESLEGIGQLEPGQDPEPAVAFTEFLYLPILHDGPWFVVERADLLRGFSGPRGLCTAAGIFQGRQRPERSGLRSRRWPAARMARAIFPRQFQRQSQQRHSCIQGSPQGRGF